jgi:hypothetical protein
MCSLGSAILEEYITSIFRVKSEPSKKPADAGGKPTLVILFDPEDGDRVCSSETSSPLRTAQYYNPEAI